MRNIVLIVTLSMLTHKSFCQWNNLIPNYSFEDVSQYPPIPNTDGNLDPGSSPFSNQMQYIADYWSVCAHWTHPIKTSFWCQGNPPVGTTDLWKYPSPTTIVPTRSKGEYYIRSQGGISNGEYGEVGVVPIENAFNSAGTPVLNTANTYYIEFYYSSGNNKQISFKSTQPSECTYSKDYGTVEIEFGDDNSVQYQPVGNPYTWRKYRGFFKVATNNYKWMTVGSGGLFDDFKIYELDDNLCQEQWYFDNTVFPYPLEIYQASDFIIAGEGVDIEAGALAGPVAVVEGSFTTFKAGNFIQLEPGFSVDVGSGSLFLEIVNQPCQDICPEVNIPRSPICISQPTNIGDPNLENTLKVVSWTPSIYLDDPNSVNPVFTPPSGSGTQIYYVTYDSDCFENGSSSIVTEAIVVSYTDTPNIQPAINTSNLQFDNYNISADINVSGSVGQIIVSYIDINGATQSSTYYRNTSFPNGIFQINQSQFPNVSCCRDVEISITAKSFCGDIVNSTINWPKNGSFGLVGSSLPNIITPNGDGVNDNLCINVGNTTCNYSIWVYNRHGTLVYQNSSSITTSSICLWDGTKNVGFPSGPNVYVSDDTYFYKVELSNDCGDSQIYDENTIQIVGSQGMRLVDTNSNQDQQASALLRKTPQIEYTVYNNTIKLSSRDLNKYNIYIFDMAGQLVANYSSNKSSETSLATGLYIMKVYSSDHVFVESQKIVVYE